ncbi:YciE/YciF ferroxidase family protein [Marinitenerispora sediminis]|uniref:Ferritin-like domain-containing protein n=1 Tax=Marinitenerispora sediminis TaxID=1931232 RepID=A0A368T334_9ACTN|nr:DUF892 family protein [Marinitenerispora sediminis]RCV49153.1 ferritin-like domain-containing protein [Marinitenerispora sediminis]RCV55936.1 ferritin-like domain-containing protein [Marinitenerispora sediminis]RCV60405.1 ferritin-like domain-containing protein [Marinitenerispora sediminis]
MRLDTPKDLFLYELSAMYDGEKKIVTMLDEAASNVRDDRLVEMFAEHKKETQEQIKNLEQCFKALDASPHKVGCAAIDGIHKELTEFLKQKPSDDVRTMFVLGGATKVEHYEIATYRGLVEKAMCLGHNDCAQLLQTNLVQEEETAGKLERCGHDMGLHALATA